MRLGIVGHAQDKFTPDTEAAARRIIREAIEQYGASIVISGHSPLGGVDIYAEEIARDMGVPTLIHAPKVRAWGAPGGFKERNLAIARDSALVVVVVVRDYPPGYNGMKFDDCYHCRGRNPRHVKSGGCWTAWKASGNAWRIIGGGS